MKSLLKTGLLASSLALTAAGALAGDVTLTMWHNHPEWKDRAQAILDKFEEANPGIKIELEEIAGTNYSARLNTALAAGEAPDLFGLPAGPEIDAAAAAGYLTDLTGALDYSGLTDAGRDAITNGDKNFAAPIMGAYTVGLYYHRNIFEEQGLTPPSTQSEFMEVCATLKERGITPLVVPAQDGIVPSFLYMMMASSVMGAEGYEQLRAGERKFTDPDLVAAAQFLQDIYPCMQDGALSTPYVEGKALAALGQGAMMPGGSADYAGYQEINPAVDLGVVPFPAVEGGTPATVTGMEYVYAINSQSEHPEEAKQFLQWMMGTEAAQMVVDTITLSTTKGVVPSENRVIKEMIEAALSNDVRVFYELPETGAVFSAAQQNVGALFLGEITPEEFATRLQEAVQPSGS